LKESVLYLKETSFPTFPIFTISVYDYKAVGLSSVVYTFHKGLIS